MADIAKQILTRPIQLADQVTKAAGEACSSKQECSDLKSKSEKLAALLRQAARSGNDLYERPTRRIIDDTEQTLNRALELAIKCRGRGFVKRVLTIIPGAAFRKTLSHLENSIGDVSWLLRVSASDADEDRAGGEYLGGLPPIAANEPILGLIWEQIAILYTSSLDARSDAAASLASLARDSERHGKLIIEEGGVGPLLKLIKEGKVEGQENAVRAIGLLGRDPESVDQIIGAGVCLVFVKILKEGLMKVQAVVAWAVSELAAHSPYCQNLFAQHNIIRLLVSHLAFETLQEHSKYAITSNMATQMDALVSATTGSSNPNPKKANDDVDDDDKKPISHPIPNKQPPNHMHNVVANTMAMKANSKQSQQNLSLPRTGIKGRELEDPVTKSYMKAMAARALWRLAKGNTSICRTITESRALLCFADLLEKGSEEVRFNSAMALMEITSVAEHDAEMRRSAFNPNSPACKAVIDQLLKVVKKADSESELLIPCVRTIGNLAKTYKATETRIISPLVNLLDEQGPEISREACIALTKFACTDNYLHFEHCKAIINAGGAKHVVQLVYFGEHVIKSSALVLLCYIAVHVADSEELAQAGVLSVIDWASKQANLVQDETVETLLQDAKGRLELFQSRGSR